jgi:hypothetical protein
LTGNYIGENFDISALRRCNLASLDTDQVPPDNVPYNSDSDDDLDEEAYDLREVSSDVEVNPDELDSDSDDAEYECIVNSSCFPF